MLLREDIEKKEEMLSPRASKSAKTKGRRKREEPCEFRTEFQRDRDKILHCNSFRRLKHKTKVFLSPAGDHYRTRLTHTLEVSQISRTICRALNLNEDLTEAIALGHDLGHTPFGHTGEAILDEIHPGGFRHNEQSLRVVELLEDTSDRPGMNLTFEVRDGIVHHSGSGFPSTLEGEIVRLSDRIAYINHDIDDALRSGVIAFDDLPKGPIKLFGERHSQRINGMVKNVIQNSDDKDHVRMDEEHWEMLLELRRYMFDNVYLSPKVKKIEDIAQVEKAIKELYAYYVENPNMLPEEEQQYLNRDDINTVVKDYIAGMTDRFAMNTYLNIFK